MSKKLISNIADIYALKFDDIASLKKNFIYYEINTSVFQDLILWINQFGGKK